MAKNKVTHATAGGKPMAVQYNIPKGCNCLSTHMPEGWSAKMQRIEDIVSMVAGPREQELTSRSYLLFVQSAMGWSMEVVSMLIEHRS
eukprot:15336186-Ditylum_brightwellii.AAC.1